MAFGSSFTSAKNARTNREIARENANQRKQELAIMGYSFDEQGNVSARPGSAAEAEQLASLEATQLAKSLQGKLLAQETDKAFEDFAYSGDADYLQKALVNNPELGNAWAKRGVRMVSNIDFEADKDLLERSGFVPTAYDTQEKRDILKKNVYKIHDGKEWKAGVANKAMAETGAYKRLGKRRSQVFDQNYEDMVNMMKGPEVNPNTARGHRYEKELNEAAEAANVPADLIASAAEEEGIQDPTLIGEFAKNLSDAIENFGGDVNKALEVIKGGDNLASEEGRRFANGVKTRVDNAGRFSNTNYDEIANTILEHRRAQALAAQGTNIQQADETHRRKGVQLDQEGKKIAQAGRALGQKDVELALKKRGQDIKLRTEGTTTTQKDLAAAERFTVDLLEEFGGEDAFMQTDFSDPKDYRKAYQDIVKIEKLEGTALSNADKKQITDIRQLLALGDPAAKLTSKDTGLLDDTLGNMQKYFKDNVKGVGSKSAYAAFRNSVRNALFGSALTEGEIKAFNEAYGTLGQQLGPVLEMFETSLNQVEAKLDSTANLMNPYSAKVRLGADQEKLEKVKGALQARIDFIKGVPSRQERKPLESIFGGN